VNGWLNSLVDKTVQCWGCGVFDSLFQVVSAAGAAMYDAMARFGMILLAVFIAFYMLYAVWKNMNKAEDFTYQKTFKPVLINSLLVVALLSTGVFFPRFVTTITMEPVADMTLLYTQTMLHKTSEDVEAQVKYTPKTMSKDGFYRPQLRDKIIELIKTGTTQFQAMIKLGLLVMDKAFSWSAFFGIGALVKHIILFLMGLTLVWGFFRLFIKFCFYFVDIIVALSFFAFFFPLSLVFFVFKNSDSPDWVKKMGNKISPQLLRDAIGSIITLGTVVITYVVIMVLVSRFVAGTEEGGTELVNQILSGGDIFAGSLNDDDMVALTMTGIIVLMYVVRFLADQIDEIAKSIVEAFGVKDIAKIDLKGTLGEHLGNEAMAQANKLAAGAKRVVNNLMQPDKKE